MTAAERKTVMSFYGRRSPANGAAPSEESYAHLARRAAAAVVHNPEQPGEVSYRRADPSHAECFHRLCSDRARRRRRSQLAAARSLVGQLSGHGRPQDPDDRPDLLRLRPGLRPGDLPAAQEHAGPSLHGRDLRPDLRNLQDLPGHPGQVPDDLVGLHRGRHPGLLRMAGSGSGQAGGCHAARHSAVQRDRHLAAATAWHGSASA